MHVFNHHIYELKKGLRRLVLHTCPSGDLPGIKEKLSDSSLSYLISPVTAEKVNVFFGDEDCIGVLQQFSSLSLNELSDQEDFILGVLLGYDLKLQCKRFLERCSLYQSNHVYVLGA